MYMYVGPTYSRTKIYAARVSYAADDAHRPPLHGFAAAARAAHVTDRRTDQGFSGAGTRGGGVPELFSTGGRVPHSPTFWTEIRPKVSPLLQLVTY